MLSRRGLLTAGAGLAVWPAFADMPGRLSFSGSQEQGGLVIGHAGAKALVTLDGKKLLVSPEGLFCFGIAYNAETPLQVTAEYSDGRTETRQIMPVLRSYDIQRIDGLDENYVEPPTEISERIAREHALIADARKYETMATDFASPIEWPCAGRLSGVYGSQRILNGKPKAPHLGVDVAAPEGTPICAAADGVVLLADEYYLEGGFTLIDHGLGVNTCYLHQSQRFVKAGDSVKRGQIIGQIGHTGRATGPHIHWGLNWFEMKLDPSRATKLPTPPTA